MKFVQVATIVGNEPLDAFDHDDEINSRHPAHIVRQYRWIMHCHTKILCILEIKLELVNKSAGLTVDDICNWLQTRSTHRPFVGIKPRCFSMHVKEKNVTSKIEYGINTSGKDGE